MTKLKCYTLVGLSTSLGSIQPCATINARMLLVYISTTVYSQVLFIQLSELEQRKVKKHAQGFYTAAQDLNPDSPNRESETLPLSQCALAKKLVNIQSNIKRHGLGLIVYS